MERGMAYIARWGGIVQAAVVDDGDPSTHKTVAKWMRAGCTIERASCAWVRKNFGTNNPAGPVADEPA